jgi:propanol-preferring alcohol dehydrogenase
MKAFQMVEWQKPPELREVEVPDPGPGEVLIKVAGAGACHSDLHLLEWPRHVPVEDAVHPGSRERRLG